MSVTKRFGNTELHVSELGLGAAEIGFANADSRTVDALIGVACELGVTVIDTAAMYLDSEEKIGDALHGKRTRFLLFTKCGRCVPNRRAMAGFAIRAARKVAAYVSGPEAADVGC